MEVYTETNKSAYLFGGEDCLISETFDYIPVIVSHVNVLHVNISHMNVPFW